MTSWYDPERLVTDDGLAHLNCIYVASDHWGRRIGTMLLARVETVLRAGGSTGFSYRRWPETTSG